MVVSTYTRSACQPNVAFNLLDVQPVVFESGSSDRSSPDGESELTETGRAK